MRGEFLIASLLSLFQLVGTTLDLSLERRDLASRGIAATGGCCDTRLLQAKFRRDLVDPAATSAIDQRVNVVVVLQEDSLQQAGFFRAIAVAVGLAD